MHRLSFSSVFLWYPHLGSFFPPLTHVKEVSYFSRSSCHVFSCLGQEAYYTQIRVYVWPPLEKRAYGPLKISSEKDPDNRLSTLGSKQRYQTAHRL